MTAVQQQQDTDDLIPNQQIALIQFYEPDNDLKQKKDLFFFQKFIHDFVISQNELLQQLSSLYPDFSDKLKSIKKKYLFLDNIDLIHDQYRVFVNSNFQSLIDQYQLNDVNNISSLTHVKIRGCFPDPDTAKNQILHFQKQRPQLFNTYGIQVGQWQPLLPPDLANEQQYSSSEQQQFMQKFIENQQKKDEVFSQNISQDKSRSIPSPQDSSLPSSHRHEPIDQQKIIDYYKSIGLD